MGLNKVLPFSAHSGQKHHPLGRSGYIALFARSVDGDDRHRRIMRHKAFLANKETVLMIITLRPATASQVTTSSVSTESPRGFTLIELLVVIAIVAILAAFLFPVFAQARGKARQSSCMSNMKQLGLGVTQYAQDYDGLFPRSQSSGSSANLWSNSWAVTSQPYVKSFDVYRCPSDPDTAIQDASWAWAGIGISYASNSYLKRDNGSVQPVTIGPFGMGAGNQMSDYWVTESLSDADISRPADSILIAERHNGDVRKAGSPCNCTNYYSGLGGTLGASISGIPVKIPDGTIAATTAYPDGPNGGVSVPHNGMANFAFVDGHVKAMKPANTNPDPTNRAQDNMWDATRR